MSNKQVVHIAKNGKGILNHCKNNPEEKFVLTLRCASCGEVINDIPPMTGEKINKDWVGMIAAAPIQTKRCSNGHGTYSDCNAHFDTYLYPPIVALEGYGNIPSNLKGMVYQKENDNKKE